MEVRQVEEAGGRGRAWPCTKREEGGCEANSCRIKNKLTCGGYSSSPASFKEEEIFLCILLTPQGGAGTN